MDWPDFLTALGAMTWVDAVDIGVATVGAWALITWIRRTRSRAMMLGAAAIAALYLAARLLNLRLTLAVFQAVLPAAGLLLVVVFQDDIRRVFARIGTAQPLRRGTPAAAGFDTMDTIASACSTLARQRTGALLVFPGSEPIEPLISGGFDLRGRLSETLLLSLFDTSSPGHDGAVVIRGELVERFGIRLPLSEDASHATGTRHAAALGLSERCDAVVVVVSEERGTFSVMHHGTIERPVDELALKQTLARFETRKATPPAARSQAGVIALALVASLLAWSAVRVSELRVATRELTVRAQTKGLLGAGLSISEIRSIPEAIRVRGSLRRLEGVRFLETEPVDLSRVTRSTTVARQVLLPQGLELPGDQDPTVQVRIRVESSAPDAQ